MGIQAALQFCRRHPVWITTGIALAGVIVGILTNIGGITDSIKYAFGTNWHYSIANYNSPLRIGERTSFALYREYATNTDRHFIPVEDKRCLWTFNPPLAGAAAGTLCRDATVIASEADFKNRSTSSIQIDVSATIYDPDSTPPSNRKPAQTVRLTILNEFVPTLRLEPAVALPGQSVKVWLEFPPAGSPATKTCEWTVDGQRWAARKLFLDPTVCETELMVPREADGDLSLRVDLITGTDRPPIQRTAILRVSRPPGRYFLLVLDYTKRMTAQQLGDGSAFDKMKRSVQHALDYLNDTVGGFVGVTAFGGAPPSASGLASTPPDCSNIRPIIPFGPVVKTETPSPLELLAPAGDLAPLAAAIRHAYREYEPFKMADQSRPLDRFFLVVVTGGGDTCGMSDLYGMLRDMLSRSELQGLFITNRLLEVVVATPPRDEEAALDRILYGQDYHLRVRDLLRISVHAARWKVCILLVS